MPIISVIVPVYNVEKYLLQCVDAILAQTFTDFELILVDDGSTDNSSVLCNAYAEKDKRVRVLHKENGGQAEARNLGIDIARGQYLTFIDSDDLVSPEYLDRLLNAIQETNAEIAACGEISFQDGEPVSFDSEAACGYDRMSGREICVSHYQTKWPMPVAPWGKLYKAALFKEIRFPTGKIYEDQGTVPRLWYLAEKIAMIRGGAFMLTVSVREALPIPLFPAGCLKMSGMLNCAERSLPKRTIRKWRRFVSGSGIFFRQNTSFWPITTMPLTRFRMNTKCASGKH